MIARVAKPLLRPAAIRAMLRGRAGELVVDRRWHDASDGPMFVESNLNISIDKTSKATAVGRTNDETRQH